MSVAPKVVLITGCSQGGIGFSLCQEYAWKGCKVYATARKYDSMEGLEHPNIKRMILDVTDAHQIEDVVSTVITTEGRVDILVNNAGATLPGPLLDVTLEQARRAFETNTLSTLAVCKTVIPHMARRSRGLVINVSSVMGEIPTPWMGLYAATKAALHSITQSLWMECKAFNVEVMLVVPGQVKSNIAVNAHKEYQMPDNSLYHKYMKNIMHRIAYSQLSGSIPADECAREIVTASLSPEPPRYITLGGASTIFRILTWLPRTWVLGYFWRRFTAGVQADR
ncbi:oxidoreductase [Cristinia sonorae]|uniref:Oxidoreductase n=1 Tax=Cristinia sonorae TaxID=1940300 RepID=A0A8K0UL78_9AGAR|nr:oxidoreductase [Cristinia sonorae]